MDILNNFNCRHKCEAPPCRCSPFWHSSLIYWPLSLYFFWSHKTVHSFTFRVQLLFPLLLFSNGMLGALWTLNDAPLEAVFLSEIVCHVVIVQKWWNTLDWIESQVARASKYKPALDQKGTQRGGRCLLFLVKMHISSIFGHFNHWYEKGDSSSQLHFCTASSKEG